MILYIDQTYDVINDHIETDQRSTRANLPDVARDGYIEVIAPQRMQIGTLDNLTVFHNKQFRFLLYIIMIIILSGFEICVRCLIYKKKSR